MRRRIIIFVLFVSLLQLSSCIVRTPYDKQYTKPHPHAYLKRPHAVKPNVAYRFGWISPFGYSSLREHWPRHHGSGYSRKYVWPYRFIPHTHLHNTPYR